MPPVFFGPASARLLPRFCPASAPLLPGAPGASGCAWLAQPTANRWGAKSIARRRDIFSRSRYGRPFVCVCVCFLFLFLQLSSPLFRLSLSPSFSLLYFVYNKIKKRGKQLKSDARSIHQSMAAHRIIQSNSTTMIDVGRRIFSPRYYLFIYGFMYDQ